MVPRPGRLLGKTSPVATADPRTLVVDSLERLQTCLTDRDVDGALACFVPDGAVFGAGPDEVAHGVAELRRLFTSLLARDLRVRWEVKRSYVRVVREVVWFVAGAEVSVSERGGREGGVPHQIRLSGTMRSDDSYRFELFNGFEPVLRPGLAVVA